MSLPDWVNDFAAQAAQRPGAALPWLSALRQRALDRFAQEGWPTTRIEAWHHTSLALLEQQRFAPRTQGLAAELVKAVRQQEDGYFLVFVDGRYDASLSSIGVLPAGARLGSLAQCIEQDGDWVQSLYGDESLGESTAALNLALAHDGAVLSLAAGTQLEQPVHLVFVSTQGGSASFTRNLVALESGASATVVEHYVGRQADEASLSSAVTRLNVARDANLTHLKLQQEAPQDFHLANIDVQQAQGSVFNSHSLSFGARLARNDISTVFNGERCETLFNGLYFVDGRRHVDHNTVINHAQPNCQSREYYRGILADTARGVFCGRVLVGKGADGTDAVQRSDSLLLSKLARADSRPELEIYADDVKCAHGATVGQLDADSLFYLRSRGMTQEDARNMLIYAFAAQSLDRIASDGLRRRATAGISALLPGGLALGELA
ncbi:MAG: Fe-S cluster assembly protein SufD [Alcaligenes sp.]